MLIGSRSLVHTISDSNLNIMIENRPIKQVQDTIGVILDQHLSWKSNTESICTVKKITSAISVIRKLKEFVSIFNAIVQPYFTYCCCEVWDIFGETQITTITKASK